MRMLAWIALMFVALLALCSSSTWGQLQEENTLYARGTGMFYFSLFNLALWLVAAAAMFGMLASRPLYGTRAPASPFPAFLGAFGFLLLAHVVVGLAAGQALLAILSYTGLLNVLNMALFSLLLIAALADEAGRRRLLLTLVGLAAARSVFGLVRYAWFGGDSANPYRNFEGLDIRLVYFDIGDNYIAALAAFCIAWLLLKPGVRITLWRRSWLLALLAMEVATVALSFRRSSLLGLVLMCGVLLWQLPWQRRVAFGAVGALAAGTAAMVLLRERLQANVAAIPGSGFLASLLYDVGPQRATDTSRFYELEAAAHSLQGSWLFGLGSWGSFRGNEEALDYHFGKFDFVHSGFGHLVLKSGLAGLLLFVALLAAVIIHYWRLRPALRGNSALLADAGLASLLFWLPTLLIGTPVIEFRTMLLIGLALAMPYLAAGRQGAPHTRTGMQATTATMLKARSRAAP